MVRDRYCLLLVFRQTAGRNRPGEFDRPREWAHRRTPNNQAPEITRSSSSLLPGAAQRVRFGVEDNFVEIQGARRREEEIEVFERFREGEAFHLVALLFRDDVGKRGVAGVGAAVFDE